MSKEKENTPSGERNSVSKRRAHTRRKVIRPNCTKKPNKNTLVGKKLKKSAKTPGVSVQKRCRKMAHSKNRELN